MKLSVLDMFSGIGGFSLGLERTGHFETKHFAEIEPFPIKTLQKNWPHVPNLGDVSSIDFRGFDADVICGGFPCTDISIASKSKDGIYGKRSGLWKEFFRAIDQARPRYVLIENVFALLGRGLNTILQDLATCGYDATYTMLDSKYFGVPQRRRRVYILGVRDGIPAGADIFKHSERNTAEHAAQVQAFDGSFEWDFTQGQRVANPFAFFTRQRSDQFACLGLSGTLAKRDYKSYSDLVLQDGVIRRIVPEERMLLQGFPIDWLADGSDIDKFKANGMTVPVVEWIGHRVWEFHQQVTTGVVAKPKQPLSQPAQLDLFSDEEYHYA